EQGPARDTRQTEWPQVGVACLAWRKPQSGTRQPQSRRRQAGRSQCSACVRRAEARLAGAFEGCRDAVEPHTRSGEAAGGCARCGINRACCRTKERSSAESSCEKTQAGREESGKTGQEKGEGIDHVCPALSNHSPAHHHGKRPGRERNAAGGGGGGGG